MRRNLARARARLNGSLLLAKVAINFLKLHLFSIWTNEWCVLSHLERPVAKMEGALKSRARSTAINNGANFT